jgi:hypothetical protein
MLKTTAGTWATTTKGREWITASQFITERPSKRKIFLPVGSDYTE